MPAIRRARCCSCGCGSIELPRRGTTYIKAGSASGSREVAVPRFYFHVFNDDTCLDQEGQELVDVEAARVRAVESARSLMCETLGKGEIVLSHHIAVEDGDGVLVCDVTFGQAVTVRP
jgi:hypothetical protein